MTESTSQLELQANKRTDADSLKDGGKGRGSDRGGLKAKVKSGLAARADTGAVDEVDQQIAALVQQVAHAKELPTAAAWAGTSVLICAPGQDWPDSGSGSSSSSNITRAGSTAGATPTSAYPSSGVTWVVTEYVEQLSWCFLQLQNILNPRLDYIGSQDVFSHLADAAIDFLGRSSAGELDFQPEARAKALLLFVLQCARRLVRNHA